MPFLITLSFSGIFFALLYMFYYKTASVHWYMLSAVGAAWLYIPIKKITKNYNLYANWLVLCCLYGVGYTSYLMGSLNSASVWWLIFIPILAAFFLDLIQTFIWSLIALSAVALLTLSHLNAFEWLTYKNELRTDNPTLAISLSLFVIISCAAALILYLRAIIDKLESQKESLIEESYIHASTQSLGELASGIAHEVNNPLAIIKGHANFLESKTETLNIDEDTKKSLISHIQRIDVSTNNASSTVRSLGYLTRGINLEKPEIFKINEVLEVVKELNSKKFLLKNIELKIEASDQERNFKVYASKGQVIQVLVNLLNNSFDAIQDNMGSWVTMSYKLSKERDYLLLNVTDSGIGINIKDRHSIFKPLYSTKEVGSGQGLGLSLAKTIMKKNNGDLFLDHSAHNTTFVVKLAHVQ
jgi:signal transduction histidine kinase